MDLLRSMFGPSKDEIWGKLANDIGGHYEDGGWFGRDVLRYRSGEWEITLDTYTSGGRNESTYTRMRAPFKNKGGLYFKVYRQGFLSSIGKALGMQDIEVGDPFFDDSFVVQGNSLDKVKLLLADPTLKNLIQQQPDICFLIQDDEGWFMDQFPQGVDELHFQCYGVLKDEPMLKHLFEMFTLTLQKLVEIDSAYPDNPGVRL